MINPNYQQLVVEKDTVFGTALMSPYTFQRPGAGIRVSQISSACLGSTSQAWILEYPLSSGSV